MTSPDTISELRERVIGIATYFGYEPRDMDVVSEVSGVGCSCRVSSSNSHGTLSFTTSKINKYDLWSMSVALRDANVPLASNAILTGMYLPGSSPEDVAKAIEASLGPNWHLHKATKEST